MLLGAHLAGVAFANAPVAGVHALAYPLGGRFHVPHGLSNALMLPHVLNFNMPSAMSLYGELGAFVDPSLGALDQRGRADGLVKALCALCQRRLDFRPVWRSKSRPLMVRRCDMQRTPIGALCISSALSWIRWW